ncbi:glycosyltransferase, partial [Salmonella enterica subsp. enterica serovar Kentucky]|nr:glycosyltransferase [Salmonella enterica subsp. enterica serovar Kentucky]
RQDYRHWEMIIVDDCSSSYQQLQQFVEELNDPRVRYTHNARKDAKPEKNLEIEQIVHVSNHEISLIKQLVDTLIADKREPNDE